MKGIRNPLGDQDGPKSAGELYRVKSWLSYFPFRRSAIMRKRVGRPARIVSLHTDTPETIRANAFTIGPASEPHVVRKGPRLYVPRFSVLLAV
jgi:hypothetical protein